MLGNSRVEGSWDRSVIVAAVLQAAWLRTFGSNSRRGNNFCGVQTLGLCPTSHSSMSLWHMGCSACGKKGVILVCLVPRWMCGHILHLPHMASIYCTLLITRKSLYSKYYHVNELYTQWLGFGFPQCTVCLILSLQRSKLPPFQVYVK